MERMPEEESGETVIRLKKHPLFDGIQETTCSMHHQDYVTEMPRGFSVIASTERTPVAAMADDERRFYGVQFHPEATPERPKVFANFLKEALVK